MTSKLSVILLGIFAEREIGAYELIKLLEEHGTMEFYPMGESTIYAAVKKLEKQGLITGEKIPQDTAPPKTIYKITEKGEEQLKQQVGEFLNKWLEDGGEFEIGLLLSSKLRKDEVLKRLKNKLLKLEKIYFDLRKKILSLEQNRSTSNFSIIAVHKHRLHLIEAERKTINELIKELNIHKGKRSAKSFYDLRTTS